MVGSDHLSEASSAMTWPGLESVGGTDTAKRFRRGTDRVCSPEETWGRIRGLLGAFGITRVADLTGLDRVGLPVFAAYRPRLAWPGDQHGQGHDPDGGTGLGGDGGDREAGGRAACPPDASRNAAGLPEDEVVAVERLPRLRAEGLGRAVPILWVTGHELGSGRPCWVPYERVTTDYSTLADPERDVFTASTTGWLRGTRCPRPRCTPSARPSSATPTPSGSFPAPRGATISGWTSRRSRIATAVTCSTGSRPPACTRPSGHHHRRRHGGVRLQRLRPLGAGGLRDPGGCRVGVPSEARDRAPARAHRGRAEPPGAHQRSA